MELPAGCLAQPVPGIVPTRDAREPVRVLVASLAPGGAERIVIEWLEAEVALGRTVELAVVHRRQTALAVPPGLHVRHRARKSPEEFLAALALDWRGARAPVSVHMVPDALLGPFRAAGVRIAPVVHNVREGWRNDPALWDETGVPVAVACAEVVRSQLLEDGCRVPVVSVRHRPRVGAAATDPEARRAIRSAWGVGESTLMVGALGAIKAQKDYARAVEVLSSLAPRRDAVLVILGGLLDRAALAEFERVIDAAIGRGVQARLRLPGFQEEIDPWLAAFDVLLNTSLYEGLSIATQEALAAGLPVIATDVGGQREIDHPGLTLLPPEAPASAFADRLATLPVRSVLEGRPFARAPRSWSLTLTSRLREGPSFETLFVSANLNAGGAQRSLVNLAGALAGRHRFAIAVCGETTHAAFPASLARSGVEVFRACELHDDIAIAESLLAHASARGSRNLCFWNVAPGVKLAAQRFAPPGLRVIDVSPGRYAFEELESSRAFGDALATSPEAYYRGLAALVLKYRDGAAPRGARQLVIPNGVAPWDGEPALPDRPRFLVSGRIAPSKRIESILEAFGEVRATRHDAELHLFGTVEERHRDHGELLAAAAGPGVTFRGASFEGLHFDEPWTAAIVLGTHQGSPNAVLEAMAAGVPVIANDSGGTRDLITDARGWLLPEAPSVVEIAGAMHEVWMDPLRASCAAAVARQVARTEFTMAAMAERYLELLS